MKVLAIHNYYQIRAGEDLAFDQSVNALRELGHDVETLTRDNTELREPLRLILTALFSMFSPLAFLSVFKTARRLRPDVAFVQNVFPMLTPATYLALKCAGVRVVQRIYNYRALCPNGIFYTQGAICERCSSGALWNSVRYRCYRNSRLATLPMALAVAFARLTRVWRWGVDHYITSNRFIEGKLALLFAHRPVTLIPNSAVQAESAEPHFGPRTGGILFVGRVVREKGVFTLLEAVAELKDVTVKFVGSGEDEAELKRLITERGLTHCRALGYIGGEGYRKLMREAQILAVPSEWYENMPLIVSDAMLSGTPVVASRINGIPESIRDGETGRLAEPGNAGDWLRVLREALNPSTETERMARAAFDWARVRFAPKTNALALADVLGAVKH